MRKGLEVYFTFLIEHLWGKERIMEVYLNVAEMGEGIYGAEAAAQHWFGRPASRLTQRQSALLVACFPDPRRRNPSRPTAYLNRRASQIEALMPKMGKIAFDKLTVAEARDRYDEYMDKKQRQHERRKK